VSRYRKTVAALIGALLTWAGTAYVPDGTVDRAEGFSLAIAVATAVGVYAVTNAAPRQSTDEVSPTFPLTHTVPAPPPLLRPGGHISTSP
jgi:hypothetical protein